MQTFQTFILLGHLCSINFISNLYYLVCRGWFSAIYQSPIILLDKDPGPSLCSSYGRGSFLPYIYRLFRFHYIYMYRRNKWIWMNTLHSTIKS